MLHESTLVSSHDLINPNHRQISLTGADRCNPKLSAVIQCGKTITQFFNIGENLQGNNKNIYISGLFWTFKIKFQTIHAANYITVFLSDSNNCFFYM